MRTFLLILCGAAALQADTITLKSNLSVNGTVVFKGGSFQVAARYRGSKDTVEIAASEVRLVRFNTLDNNVDAPPPSIRPRGNEAGAKAHCEITLSKDGSIVKGELLEITSTEIHLAGKVVMRSDVSALRVVE